MAITRTITALLAVLVVVCAGASAHAKTRSKLAVSVTQVGPKAPVHKKLTFRSRVSWRGSRANLSYEWYTVDGAAIPPDAATDGPVLVIPAGYLEPGQSYHLRLRVTAIDGDETVEATADVSFQANEPPSGGKCTAAVKQVRPGQLRLTLAVSGWTDPDGPPHYRFELVRGKKTLVLKNWRHERSVVTTVLLAPGKSVVGRCRIRDRFGDEVAKQTKPIARPDESP